MGTKETVWGNKKQATIPTLLADILNTWNWCNKINFQSPLRSECYIYSFVNCFLLSHFPWVAVSVKSSTKKRINSLKSIVLRPDLVKKTVSKTSKPPSLRPTSQMWISFLETLPFSGKWVGFLIPSLQGTTSAWIANVPMRRPSLSFHARKCLLHCQRNNNERSTLCFWSET